MAESGAPREYVEHFKKIGFSIGEQIGFGGSGTVYRALHERLQRDVAIKLFDNPFTKSDAALRKRFEREARILAKAQHPSIPFVITCGSVSSSQDATPFIVMQYIDGDRLDTIINKERRLKAQVAVGYLRQVLGALACAHQHQIVHCDVKPSNIMIVASGHCYLIDFSIGVSLNRWPGLTRVTNDRQPGSIEYMSPEQRDGSEPDFRADLYSAGVVLYEMLVGHNRVSLSSLDVDLSQVSDALREVVRKACRENINERFQAADEFRRALEPLEGATVSLVRPATAICDNYRCNDTRWARSGYYEGPSVIEYTSDAYCGSCGSKLIYPCEQCGRPFSNARFCGQCGTQAYQPPYCEMCGLLLQKIDRYKDTAKEGCSRCKSEIPF